MAEAGRSHAQLLNKDWRSLPRGSVNPDVSIQEAQRGRGEGGANTPLPPFLQRRSPSAFRKSGRGTGVGAAFRALRVRAPGLYKSGPTGSTAFLG